MLIGLTEFLAENFLTVWDNLEFFLRMLLSGFLGALIGLERASRNKDAGIRTHIIIGVTAATLMIVSKYAFMDLSDVSGVLGVRGADPARIAAQVVTGISFLCAGVIFRQGRYNVRGLTTAAGMWATASVGMAVGAGLYWVGIAETMILVIMQIALHRHPVGNDALSTQEIRVKVADDDALDRVLERLKALHGGRIVQCEITREQNGTRAKVTLRGTESVTCEEALRLIGEDPVIREVCV